jgi:hypothetical protein
MMMMLAWLTCAATSDNTVMRISVDSAVAARRAAYARSSRRCAGSARRCRRCEGCGLIAMPDAKTEPESHAAQHVAEHVAPDGLVPTLVRVIDILGAGTFENGDASDPDRHDLLRRVGIPVDWLKCFHAPGAPSLVRWVVQLLSSGTSVDNVLARTSEITFTYQPTVAGFEVATESGEHDIGICACR